MLGLQFETSAPHIAEEPKRTDIACFVGFVGRRHGAIVPQAIRTWLMRRYTAVAKAYELFKNAAAAADPSTDPSLFWQNHPLLNIPVPIESWSDFDLLFDWQRRPLKTGLPQTATTYLGAAIRSFFAQGGRKCYIIRVDDPFPLLRSGNLGSSSLQISYEAQAALDKLIPGYNGGILASDPTDESTWSGISHLFGLEDVSFLCLPDLADIVGRQPERLPKLINLPEIPEQFVICSEDEPPAAVDLAAARLGTPRCGLAGYAAWTEAVSLIGSMLKRYTREVQFVTAVPLPQDHIAPAVHMLSFLEAEGPLANSQESKPFIQLVFPWVKTLGSANLPEQLESPDAVLCGVLARNALSQGTFRSAADLDLADVYGVEPVLSREQRYEPSTLFSDLILQQRISLFGPTPTGLRLLSDVTADGDSYRPGSINRLISFLVKAARQVGESVLFESSNEILWARLREHLTTLMTKLYDAGAFRGASPEQAFKVRCDRSTMSQHDIDNGRVIVEITFDAAYPIETITVTLNMEEGGQISLSAV